MYNSLSQTLLKITSPGIPDFYRGTELWDFSLVDPDNRRPVDYDPRIKLLEELKRNETAIAFPEFFRELALCKDNGKIKLYLIYKALNYRKANREIFERGEYSPLEAMGEKAMNVCSFVRKLGNSMLLIVAPRFFTRLTQQPDAMPLGKDVWDDSFIIALHEETEKKYRNIFTGEVVTSASYKGSTILYLSEIFTHFPAALLERIA